MNLEWKSEVEKILDDLVDKEVKQHRLDLSKIKGATISSSKIAEASITGASPYHKHIPRYIEDGRFNTVNQADVHLQSIERRVPKMSHSKTTFRERFQFALMLIAPPGIPEQWFDDYLNPDVDCDISDAALGIPKWMDAKSILKFAMDRAMNPKGSGHTELCEADYVTTPLSVERQKKIVAEKLMRSSKVDPVQDDNPDRGSW